jgi:hypothetical protein
MRALDPKGSDTEPYLKYHCGCGIMDRIVTLPRRLEGRRAKMFSRMPDNLTEMEEGKFAMCCMQALPS